MAMMVGTLVCCGTAHAGDNGLRGSDYGETLQNGRASSWQVALHAELARVYLQSGAIDVAEDEARRALAIDATDRTAAHVLALVALRHGDDEAASHYFERALAAQAGRALVNGPGGPTIRAGDPVLAANYAMFLCARAGQCASAGVQDAPRTAGGENSQLRAQSIAIDNSPAFRPFRKPLNDGRTGQSQQATGGTMDRRNRQEYSSEELRDE
ncbi:MAG TPA: hypothetical protein VL424_19180 [Pararobbsia sp.]|jgi:hypothetical protein|nr:hypothetical protein [Pararobbsia sp.]